ncbi:hypothetical protein RHSIM_Rhsim01G0023700 [Rhododendron simsii]|uniref:TRF2/HOY1 PH-like domain-containing protein n=1 Tax=Rhododendron simsii TaxID=118357 RepID=A0A834HGB6_RHOSS|nr:hypothetical protein RHSIM_Rhsim01G0023700 [Rhododendron simsii]
MVHLVEPGRVDPAKLEVEDPLEEEYGSLHKRSKASTQFNQWNTGNNEFPVPATQYNPLDEPSPLGLRLRKSPSLLDLIQMRLSQSSSSTVSANHNLTDKDFKGTTASTSNDKLKAANFDKLKATNFPALLLRIGNWEYVSKYEGDLVAKCYFAKHKIVWEILDGGLKSKIEIQWSDIKAMKAKLCDDVPGTLTLTLLRPPLFFKETNPQPRKHTLWQAIADFTDGQASIHRQHFLQCTQGLLNKHYERLIQCDKRLNFVSQQPDLVLDSPYFDVQASAKGSPTSSFNDVESTPAAQSSSKIGQNSAGLVPEHLSPQAPSPSSVMDLRAIEGNESRGANGLLAQQSMSMSDLVNHIGHKISERMGSGNASGFKETVECQDMLENIAHILLGDTQCPAASDEKKLMSRVNSLCCLLQDPTAGPSMKFDAETQVEGVDQRMEIQGNHVTESKGDLPSCNQGLGMSRQDSFGDFLLNLPRISSLPKFLFDILEDGEN